MSVNVAANKSEDVRLVVSEKEPDPRQKPARRRRGSKRRGGKKVAAENQTREHDASVSVIADPVVNGSGKTHPKNLVKEHEKKSKKSAFKAKSRSRKTGGAVYSAIDLGTNNCRLLIAKPTKHGFRVIDAFSRIVRLGEGISKENRLSDEAMDRTIEALQVCSEKLARRGVTCMRHVATEACRIADNSQEFVERVKRETGINLDVISAAEEARLAVQGCQSLIAPDKRNALVFDIGGGSSELIWVSVKPGREAKIKGWVSIPWGVVNLTESFSKPGKPFKPKKYRAMVETVEAHLKEFDQAHSLQDVLKGRHTQFLGTSGTVTTLASLHLNLPRYNRDRVDGAWMKSDDIRALSRSVAEMSPEERAAQPCIGPERADLVVAGCAVLEAILGMWKVPSLRVADRGIREGILRGLMQLDRPRGGPPKNKSSIDKNKRIKKKTEAKDV
jgi:exopolyphosphatase/guanosine-5'-triphosphate,3'-diphosphate pyrophosphatase